MTSRATTPLRSALLAATLATVAVLTTGCDPDPVPTPTPTPATPAFVPHAKPGDWDFTADEKITRVLTAEHSFLIQTAGTFAIVGSDRTTYRNMAGESFSKIKFRNPVDAKALTDSLAVVSYDVGRPTEGVVGIQVPTGTLLWNKPGQRFVDLRGDRVLLQTIAPGGAPSEVQAFSVDGDPTGVKVSVPAGDAAQAALSADGTHLISLSQGTLGQKSLAGATDATPAVDACAGGTLRVVGAATVVTCPDQRVLIYSGTARQAERQGAPGSVVAPLGDRIALLNPHAGAATDVDVIDPASGRTTATASVPGRFDVASAQQTRDERLFLAAPAAGTASPAVQLLAADGKLAEVPLPDATTAVHFAHDGLYAQVKAADAVSVVALDLTGHRLWDYSDPRTDATVYALPQGVVAVADRTARGPAK